MRNNINNLKNYSEVNLLFHLIKYNYRRSDFLINNLLSNAIFGEKCFNKYLYCSRIYSIQQAYRGSSVLEALDVVRDNEKQLNENHEPCAAKNSTNQILLKYKSREIVSKSFENLPTILSHREYYLGKCFSLSYWSCCYREIGEEKMKFFDVILIFDEQSQKGPELERIESENYIFRFGYQCRRNVCEKMVGRIK
ncbi:hypothetical protein RS030_193021 [Cryptosporidium xiaoi]|uniref:Uncharacterized protein n=1 Tax=Cryptosporidium xiaoi TaxID=659607 RepID=A0AAV9Y1B9_9CRYT